jgi:Ca2+-binding RTX toxin-like protein
VPTDTPWTADPAHEPDLSYVAYLMTGSQYYLNELNAEASYSLVAEWPDATAGRDGAQGNVIQGEQLRGAAWSLRQIDEAAYANPTGSAEKAYFTGIENNNWQWLVAQLPTWTAQEGQTSGYIPGGYSAGVLPPWQQDYFVSTAVEAAEQGNKDALTYLEWSTNFIAGRFLNGAAGFAPHNGATYNLGTETPSGATDTTWAQMQASTVVLGQDNGTGWAITEGGNYAELALQSLAGLITTTESAEAVQAYGYLLGSGAPYIDTATHQTDTQFNIVPRLTDGNLLTGDNVHISNDTINGTVVSGSATADQLINETGSANVTLQGGSGMNLLFAGSGTTSLVGGGNADYLFGSTGADTFSAGAGSNYMMAGTGAATFALNNADVAQDIIAGFKIGTDHLQISQSTGAVLNTTQDMSLIQGATQDSSGSAVLHLSATHDVTLSGIAASQLTRAMFA